MRWLDGITDSTRGAPPPPQDPSPLRGTLGSSLRSPAEGQRRRGRQRIRRLDGITDSMDLSLSVLRALVWVVSSPLCLGLSHPLCFCRFLLPPPQNHRPLPGKGSGRLEVWDHTGAGLPLAPGGWKAKSSGSEAQTSRRGSSDGSPPASGGRCSSRSSHQRPAAGSFCSAYQTCKLLFRWT